MALNVSVIYLALDTLLLGTLCTCVIREWNGVIIDKHPQDSQSSIILLDFSVGAGEKGIRVRIAAA